jgi:hypothetical protein
MDARCIGFEEKEPSSNSVTAQEIGQLHSPAFEIVASVGFVSFDKDRPPIADRSNALGNILPTVVFFRSSPEIQWKRPPLD